MNHLFSSVLYLRTKVMCIHSLFFSLCIVCWKSSVCEDNLPCVARGTSPYCAPCIAGSRSNLKAKSIVFIHHTDLKPLIVATNNFNISYKIPTTSQKAYQYIFQGILVVRRVVEMVNGA